MDENQTKESTMKLYIIIYIINTVGHISIQNLEPDKILKIN